MPSTATITSTDFTSFVALTKIKSAEVNTNFSIWRGHNLPVDASASSAAHLSYDLGSSDHRWRYGYASNILQVGATNGTTTLSATSAIDVLIVNATAAVTVNLPAVSGLPDGRSYTVKFQMPGTVTGSVVLDGSGSETIDATTTVTIATPGDSLTVMKYSTGWYII
jgi:hypothetical protein